MRRSLYRWGLRLSGNKAGLAELPKVQPLLLLWHLSLRKPATATVKRGTTPACHQADPMTQTAGSTSIESSQFIKISVVSPVSALVPLKRSANRCGLPK